MKTSINGLNVIKHFEKCRLKAFKPLITDPWTIGWGHTKDVQAGDTCTQTQADAWLLEDVAEAEHGVKTTVPLSQNQFDALVSFVYNLGAPRLAGSTLLKLLNSGQYALAADQFPRWNKSAGMPLLGLTIRRETERRLFRTADGQEFKIED